MRDPLPRASSSTKSRRRPRPASSSRTRPVPSLPSQFLLNSKKKSSDCREEEHGRDGRGKTALAPRRPQSAAPRLGIIHAQSHRLLKVGIQGKLLSSRVDSRLTPSARIGRNYLLQQRQQHQRQTLGSSSSSSSSSRKHRSNRKKTRTKKEIHRTNAEVSKPSFPLQKLPLWKFDDTYHFGVSEEEALLREAIAGSPSSPRLGWCYAFLKSNDPHVPSREMWARCRIESFSSEKQQYSVTFDGRMKLAHERIPNVIPSGEIFAFAVSCVFMEEELEIGALVLFKLISNFILHSSFLSVGDGFQSYFCTLMVSPERVSSQG